MRRFTSLAHPHADDLIFGRAEYPLVTRHGLVLGGRTVYPELNFTLPDLAVEEANLPLILAQYEEIISGVLHRAIDLQVPGLVVEFETLPPMTEHPDWAMQIIDVLLEHMESAHFRHGLKTALRVTPNDNREFLRPPLLRHGCHWDRMLELFERAAAAGVEFLSIESMGGKEIHDDALQFGNLQQVLFAQCVLGVRDMQFIWSHIVPIAEKHNVHAAGDTACAFGNTAMVLAEQGMISRVFAAVVRAVSAVRSLVAYECGAVGPGKDCGYENIILKAITGYPMAGEGKTASCAPSQPCRQRRRCRLRHVVQRVGAKRPPAGRHGSDLHAGIAGLRLPLDERSTRRRRCLSQATARLAGARRCEARPAGPCADARQRGPIGATSGGRTKPLSRRTGRGRRSPFDTPPRIGRRRTPSGRTRIALARNDGGGSRRAARR